MGCHPSHWLSYFSEGLKPPTRFDGFALRWRLHSSQHLSRPLYLRDACETGGANKHHPDCPDGHWFCSLSGEFLHDHQLCGASRTHQQLTQGKLETAPSSCWHHNLGIANLLQFALLWPISSTGGWKNGRSEILKDPQHHFAGIHDSIDPWYHLGLRCCIAGLTFEPGWSRRSSAPTGAWALEHCSSGLIVGRWGHRHHPHRILFGVGPICCWCLVRSHGFLFLGGQSTGQSSLSDGAGSDRLYRPSALFATPLFCGCVSICAALWRFATSSLASFTLKEASRLGSVGNCVGAPGWCFAGNQSRFPHVSLRMFRKKMFRYVYPLVN